MTHLPPLRFGGYAESQRGQSFLNSNTWGYTSLAVARWFTPGYMLTPLRG
jgi:hypothetical protein